MSPRGKTPLITVEIPANDRCDGEEIAREIVTLSFHEKIKEWDIIYPPVRITGRHPITGSVVLDVTYNPEEWDCLESFLDDIRRGLPDLEPSELVEDLKSQLEALFERYESAREESRQCLQDIRVLRKKHVDPTRLGTIVDLERRNRARGEVEQLAGIRLHRWSNPLVARIVREARKAVAI